MILFLDYDGVLHPDPCTDASLLFVNAPRLAEVLEEFPQVAIVLSTAWRQVRSGAELLDPLPAPLRERVLGVTPTYRDFAGSARRTAYPRQAECEQWLRTHSMSSSPWLALDDRAEWFVPYCENLIECDPRSGFDTRIERRLASTLAMACNRESDVLDLVLAY